MCNTTVSVTASPDELARGLAKVIRDARTPEAYISCVATLTGYLEHIPRTPVEKAAPELLAMLKEIEWSGADEDEDGAVFCCPICGIPQPCDPEEVIVNGGHEDGCRLRALIVKAEGGAAS